MITSKNLIKEFLLNNKVKTALGCWILETRNNDGYEYYQGKGVHRLSAWIFKEFDIESELQILHKCDNPPCYNPEHLFIGTISDNRKDTFAKGHTKRLWGKALTQSQQTHCKNGHEYTIINTYNDKRGKRGCIICRQAADKRRSDKFKTILVNGIRIRIPR